MKKLLHLALPPALVLAPLMSVGQITWTPAAPEGESSKTEEHIDLLETMVRMWPKREYYLQLAAIYGQTGNDRRALELYEIAYAMGWLTRTPELVRLAQLYIREGRLREADRTLQEALELELAELALEHGLGGI